MLLMKQQYTFGGGGAGDGVFRAWVGQWIGLGGSLCFAGLDKGQCWCSLMYNG
jgi:hypothetical protein